MMGKYKISGIEFWNQINADFGNSGGVYKLFCEENGRAKPICRLLGVDTEGVLYIGKANRFLDRVIDLKKTIDSKKKSTPHVGGRRFNNNSKIGQAFPYSGLYVWLIQDENPEQKEKALLKQYFDEFGEVPPLNANDN